MFATIVVVLPSCFTGGQVCVSHGAATQVFDVASNSLHQTSIMAWYTDVVHEVKPVTSGYRLVLSYNLIHTAKGIPKPTLPRAHIAVSTLRHVLHKWSKGGYDQDSPMLAYLLQHQYSEVNLKSTMLKGKDLYLIAHLRGVAEEFNFALCLANLEYKLIGYADGPGEYGYHKRSRYYHGYSGYGEDDDDDEPTMAEVTDKEMNISNLVDLDGSEVYLGRNISLPEECLIPDDPFDEQPPDDTEYEGYMGNVGT